MKPATKLLTALFLFMGIGTAWGFNKTPGSTKSTSFAPHEFHFGDELGKMREAMDENHYASLWHRGTSAPATDDPAVILADLDGEFTTGNGVTSFACSGDRTGFAVEVRAPGLAGGNATVYWYDWYLLNGYSVDEIRVSETVGISNNIDAKQDFLLRFIENRSIVFAGWKESSAFLWIARCVLSYAGAATTLPTDADTFWGNLQGDHGYQNRIVTNAITGTGLTLTGDGATVLAPVVTATLPTNGMTITTAVNGQVAFDCSMDREDPNAVVAGSSTFTVTDKQWTSENILSFKVTPVRSGDGTIAVCGTGAQSERGRIGLDGDFVAPNQDDFLVWLTSTTGEPNLAASFGWTAAWDEPDGTHVAWVTDGEHQSRFMHVHADGIPVTTMPSAGSPAIPHYYEVVFGPGAGTVFQIVEEGMDPSAGDQSRIFRRAGTPTDLASKRTLNDRVALWPDLIQNQRGNLPPIDPPVIPLHGGPTVIFVSPRSDFLNAVQPVISRLESMGESVLTILASSEDPAHVKALVQPYYEAAVQGGDRIPVVYLVGEANNRDPALNVLGTYYYPDSTGVCYQPWGDCASDVFIVDFDGDMLSDASWSRIIGHNVSMIQNSVEAYLDVLDGRYISPEKLLFLAGDGGWDCSPIQYYRDVANNLVGLYQAAEIQTQIIWDSALDCDDYALRRDVVAAAINGGITEVSGFGRLSRNDTWYFLVQRSQPPYWEMNAVPTRQRVIGQFAGCGGGDTDRYRDPSDYPSLATQWTTADPDGTVMVAVHTENRGAWRFFHETKARRYAAHRTSGTCFSTHDAHFRTIRELGTQYPEMRQYLYGSVNYGWVVPNWGHMIGVADPSPAPAPPQVALRAFPNPFQTLATITYTVPKTGKVRVAIYDIQGRVVCQLVNGTESAGTFTAFWDGKGANGQEVASGVYFVHQEAGTASYATKIVLSR